MGKINKFAEKAKKIKRTSPVFFKTDEGEDIEFMIESRSSDEMEALSERYDAMKPNVPTRKVPSGKSFKIIELPNDADYKKEVAAINKAHFNHMALMFLAEDERPEGTEEEQLKEIAKVELAGFIGKIVTRGLEISGLTDEDNDIDEEVEVERKN